MLGSALITAQLAVNLIGSAARNFMTLVGVIAVPLARDHSEPRIPALEQEGCQLLGNVHQRVELFTAPYLLRSAATPVTRNTRPYELNACRQLVRSAACGVHRRAQRALSQTPRRRRCGRGEAHRGPAQTFESAVAGQSIGPACARGTSCTDRSDAADPQCTTKGAGRRRSAQGDA